MRMKKLLIPLLIAALFMVFALSAFASGKEETREAEEVELILWWWGEQEFPGLQGWVDDTIAVFEKEHPNVKVSATLQATENVFSDFPTASAAGNPPDLQYMWDGIYCMEWAWLDHVEPLNDYFTAKELDEWYSIPLTQFKGKHYRLGWYMYPLAWGINKKILRDSGVPESMMAPKTWDEWIQVLQKVKDAGYIPISMGAKDKLVGDWLQALFMHQQFDEYSDAIKLSVGELRWDQPRYYEHWVRIKELWDKGFINNDVNSLDQYQGWDRLLNGESAFCMVSQTFIKQLQEALGPDNVDFMDTPMYGVGKLKTKGVIDVQGIGVASGSKHKEIAAEFIRTMHKQERMGAIYTELGGFPADKNFDADLIDDPLFKKMWAMMDNGVIWINDVVPYMITDGAANSGVQRLFADDATPAELGKEAQRLAEEWRAQFPDMVDKYQDWLK
jgi:ABC-type glycerol-3-phosphate transport system substrate-binding protein